MVQHLSHRCQAKADHRFASTRSTVRHEGVRGGRKPSAQPCCARVGITIWNDDSQTYSERAEILRKNGIMELVLVFIALALFREIRLALWVVVGLVTSGLGTLAVI